MATTAADKNKQGDVQAMEFSNSGYHDLVFVQISCLILYLKSWYFFTLHSNLMFHFINPILSCCHPFPNFMFNLSNRMVAFLHFVFKSPSILSIIFCHISTFASNLTFNFISPVLPFFDRCRQISCAFLTFISCHFSTLYSNLMFCFNHHSRSFFHFLI